MNSKKTACVRVAAGRPAGATIKCPQGRPGRTTGGGLNRPCNRPIAPGSSIWWGDCNAAAGLFCQGIGTCQPWSDIRLKHDIVPLARLGNGIGIYRFRYKGNDRTVYVGVMAQEVQNIVPRAVSRDSAGYLRVDYSQLGLEFMTWREWVARNNAGLWPGQ